MKYPVEQIDPVAAEYVLGTLKGAARRRMETLIGERADIRHAVWRWERSLGQLGHHIKPIAPPRRVLKAIARRVDPRSDRSRSRGWWGGLGFGLPVAAALAWIALTLPPVVPSFDRVAVFADTQTLWVVRANLDDGLLEAEAVNATAAGGGRVFELWALPAAGPPESLGLLPAGVAVAARAISAPALAALRSANSLAISIEPPGGSPTGLPTGPVVHQASLVSL